MDKTMEDVSSAAMSVASTEHQPRLRTMTGSSMGSLGSFSSYLQEKESPRVMIVTSPHYHSVVNTNVAPITPDASSVAEKPLESRNDQLARELEQARWERAEALEALRQLAEGMRLVTRQIKQSHNQAAASTDGGNEEESVSSSRHEEDSCQHNTLSCTSSIQSYVSDYDRQISDISNQLECSELGADLLGLSHAAHMVNENVRMVSREASDLVQDVQSAQQSEKKAIQRSQKAERLAKRLYNENQTLEKQVETLKAEKKVLKREVKTLRQERAASQKQESQALRSGMLRAMEQYVAGALKVHERQLARAKPPKPAEKDEPVYDITKDLREDYVDSPGCASNGSRRDNHASTVDEAMSENDSSCDTTPIKNTDGTVYVEEKKDDEEEVVSRQPSSSHKTPGMGFGSAGGLGFGKFGGKKKSRVKNASAKAGSEPEQPQSDRSSSSRNLAGNAGTSSSKAGEKQLENLPQPGRASYKPLTFMTPKRMGHHQAAREATSSSKQDEENLGSRMRNFIWSIEYKDPPPELEKPKKPTSLLKLDDESMETADNEEATEVKDEEESESPSDSLPVSKDEEQPMVLQENLSSTTDVAPPNDFIVTFDSTAMNDYVLSPVATSTASDSVKGTTPANGTSSGEARSVTISFEGQLLRSLAVPSSETPLSIQPRPSPPPVDDGLYEC